MQDDNYQEDDDILNLSDNDSSIHFSLGGTPPSMDKKRSDA